MNDNVSLKGGKVHFRRFNEGAEDKPKNKTTMETRVNLIIDDGNETKSYTKFFLVGVEDNGYLSITGMKMKNAELLQIENYLRVVNIKKEMGRE